MLKAIFFDLDGSLLPLDEQEFSSVYFDLISDYMQKYGYEKEELVNVILEGTKRMYKNDGTKTNEQVFWDFFKETYGDKKIEDKKYFNEFYLNEFSKTKKCCKTNELAIDIVNYARSKVPYVILSTNPIFPYFATLERMSFVGLKKEDFDYITSYENSYYTKPNPKYFLALLKMFNLKPDEVIIFGNNDVEDYLCAKYAQIDCYLIGDSLILHKDKKIECEKIAMKDVKRIIDLEVNKRSIG